jgi:hypothetical protein
MVFGLIAIVLAGAGILALGALRSPERSDASPADGAGAGGAVADGAGASFPAPDGSGSPAVAGSPCGAWECAQAARFAAAEDLVAEAPGRLGIVVRDRVTGAVWRAGSPDHPVWTASTIKLALAADLLERARAGSLRLDATNRRQITQMLDFSSNSAADQLWRSFRLSTRLSHYQTAYGMTGLHFPTGVRYWGHMKCTAEDLAALMSYVLDHLAPADLEYVVTTMRAVDPIQQWGVWSAGATLTPGVKAGWSIEPDPGGEHWVTNSVGFAGPYARYVVAIMYQLPPGVNSQDGDDRCRRASGERPRGDHLRRTRAGPDRHHPPRPLERRPLRR